MSFFNRSLMNRTFPLAASLTVIGAAHAQAATTGVETLGRARFTVITPNLIRLEDSADKNFVDQPSMFAIKRDARFTGYQVKRSGRELEINTGAVRLRYTDDGKAFSPANLKASVRQGKGWIEWTPGSPNRGNLGGPAKTLDGVFGPIQLPDGLISRDGWFQLEDSRGPLLTKDWVETRPRSAGTDWYLFGYGQDYRAAFKSLAAISGEVPLPRRNTLGAWYSRYWAYTSDDFRNLVKEYKEHDFPLDNMVLDMDWHRDGWTGWSWNRKLLPDAEKLLQDLHAENLAVTLNLHPADGVGPHEDAYEPFMRAMGADPDTKQTVPFDIGNKRYADALFKEVHRPLEAAGVDFWWLDWQQWNGTKSVPELTNLQWLNYLYYKETGRSGRRGQNFS
ncbi:alpha-xylosidase, partial [bacterium]